MNTISTLPSVIAMTASLAACISLGAVVRKLGGEIGLMLRLLAVGLFLAVFLHAGLELAQVFGLFGATTLMIGMATLLSLGSLAFCAAAWVGLRALR